MVLQQTTTGGRILSTADYYLLTRIHHAKTIFVDTTFKRTLGTLKSGEVVMYDKEVERGMYIIDAYRTNFDYIHTQWTAFKVETVAPSSQLGSTWS